MSVGLFFQSWKINLGGCIFCVLICVSCPSPTRAHSRRRVLRKKLQEGVEEACGRDGAAERQRQQLMSQAWSSADSSPSADSAASSRPERTSQQGRKARRSPWCCCKQSQDSWLLRGHPRRAASRRDSWTSVVKSRTRRSLRKKRRSRPGSSPSNTGSSYQELLERAKYCHAS